MVRFEVEEGSASSVEYIIVIENKLGYHRVS